MQGQIDSCVNYVFVQHKMYFDTFSMIPGKTFLLIRLLMFQAMTRMLGVYWLLKRYSLCTNISSLQKPTKTSKFPMKWDEICLLLPYFTSSVKSWQLSKNSTQANLWNQLWQLTWVWVLPPWNLWQNICSSLLAHANRSGAVITDRVAALSEGVPSAALRGSQCLVNTCINDPEENLESLLIKNADDSVWESGK